MAARTTIIGKVAVKVFPDTSDFRQDALAKLRAIEKSIGRIKVELDIDGDHLVSELEQKVEEAEARVGKINVHVNLERDDSINRGIKQIEAQLEKLRETKISVELDEASLTAARDMLQEELEKTKVIEFEVTDNPAGLKALRDRVDQMIAEKNQIKFEVLTDEDSLNEFRGQLDDLIADYDGLDLSVDLDSDGSLLKEIAKVEAALAKMRETEIHVKLDEDSLNAARDMLQERLEETKPIQFKIADDPQGLRSLRDKVSRLISEKHMLEFDVNSDEESLRKFRHKLDDLIDDYDGSKIRMYLRMDSGMARLELARLARNRIVELIPRVNKVAAAKAATALAALSGARIIKNALTSLRDWFRDVDKALPKIAAVALAVTNLTSLTLTAASNLFAIGSSLASIAGAALALPGIFGGLAIGIGATVAVLKDFNTVLPEVGKKMSALQDVMSKSFWKEAKRPIRELIDTLLPQFTAGLEKTATALGGWFAGLADGFKGVFNGALAGMFRDLNDSIDIAATGTKDFASILKTLGQTGAGYLPDLARWFVDLADKFDDWLVKAQKSGELDGFIRNGVAALKDLGRVAKEAGGILSGIADAAERAGGSSLGMLADTLERIHKAIDNPAFQDGLVRVLGGAHAAIDQLANGAGPGLERLFESLSNTLPSILIVAGDTLGNLVGGLADALAQPAVMDGLRGLFDGLSEAIDGILPSLPTLGEAFGGLASMAGDLLETVGPNLGTVFQVLGDALNEIIPQVQPLIPILGEALTTVIKELLPPLADAAVAITESLVPAVKALLPAVEPIAKAVGAVVERLAPLAPAIVGVTVAFQAWSMLKDIWAMKELLVGLVKAKAGMALLRVQIAAITIGQKLAAAASKVWAAAQWLINAAMTANPIGIVIVAIAALVAGIVIAYQRSETFRNVVNAAFKGIADSAKWLWEQALKPAFRFITDAFLALAGVIIHGAADAFGWIPGIGDRLKGAARRFDEFRDNVNRALNGVKDSVDVTVRTKGDREAARRLADLRYQIDRIPRSVTIGVTNKVSKIPLNALGTPSFQGGVTWVGERGPELVRLPAGSSIYSNEASRQMAGAGSGPTLVQNIYNPVQEKTSVSTNKALQRAAALGAFG